MRVFFIGFNKTGSTSFHEFFLENNYNSLHSSAWWYFTKQEEYGKYEFFLDGYERLHGDIHFPDLKRLVEYFPDAQFVLNTRDIDNWIHSRLNHRCKDYLTKEYTKFDDNLIYEWVNNRNTWYSTVFDFFKDKSERLLVVNLEKDGSLSVVESLEKFLKVSFKDKNIQVFNKNNSEREKKQRNRLTVDNFLRKYVKPGSYTSDLHVELVKK